MDLIKRRHKRSQSEGDPHEGSGVSLKRLNPLDLLKQLRTKDKVPEGVKAHSDRSQPKYPQTPELGKSQGFSWSPRSARKNRFSLPAMPVTQPPASPSSINDAILEDEMFGEFLPPLKSNRKFSSTEWDELEPEPLDSQCSAVSSISIPSGTSAIAHPGHFQDRSQPTTLQRNDSTTSNASEKSEKSSQSLFSFEGPSRSLSQKYYKQPAEPLPPSNLKQQVSRRSWRDEDYLSDATDELYFEDEVNVWDDEEDLSHLDGDYSIDDDLLDEVNSIPADMDYFPPRQLSRSQSVMASQPERPSLSRQTSLVIRRPDSVLTLYSPAPSPTVTPSRALSRRTTLSRIEEG